MNLINISVSSLTVIFQYICILYLLITASSEGGRPKGYPDMDHESPQAAFRFTQKEIQKKRNLGFVHVCLSYTHVMRAGAVVQR